MKILAPLIVLFILAGGAYYVYKNNGGRLPNIMDGTSPLASASPTTTPAPTIPADWKTYTSRAYGFTISYPSDIKQETTAEGERFLKPGPTQSLGTELYDGIAVFIKSGSTDGLSLEAYAKKRFDITKNDQLHPTVTPLKPITVAGLSGWTYSISSFGDARMIFLPKGTSEYLEIQNSTIEPKTREQTFEKTVSAMLNTLTL